MIKHRLLLFFCSYLLSMATFSQSGVINITPGTLSSTLNGSELLSTTKLNLSGTIDARDFKTMRDLMPALVEIDLSKTNIVAYSGTEGTDFVNNSGIYNSNTVPFSAFMKDWVGKKNLKSITLPTTLTTIDWSAFRDCDGLTSVSIPASVEGIGGYVFMDCDGLTSIEIPSSVRSIGSGVFWNCINLSSIKVNQLVPYDFLLNNKTNVFTGVNKNSCVLFVPYGSKAAYQAADQWKDFVNIVEMPGFMLSANNANIAAVAGSASTVDVTTNVAWTASSNQTWLNVSPTSGTSNHTLTLTATANPTIAARMATVTVSAIGVDSKTITITQDGANLSLAVTPGALKTSFTTIELASITKLTLTGTIDARDFKTMRDLMPLLTEIDLTLVNILAYNGIDGSSTFGNKDYPANTIPETAFMDVNFKGKANLTSVILPNSITSIAQNAFYECTGLKAITVHSLVSDIGDDAFSYCTGLTNISIPATVTLIGDRAFSGCSGLIDVDNANPNYSSKDGVLFNKAKTILIQCPISKMGTYSIPESVITIGQFAFNFCVNLNSINLPFTLSAIADYGFFDCPNLDGTMTIPSTVSTIGKYAFSFCPSLDLVNIPSSVTSIGDYAFYNCGGIFMVDNANPNYSSQDGLLFNKTKTTLIQCGSSKQGSYVIPSTVSVIGPSAFSRCKELINITIPTSTTTIGSSAFWGCISMTSTIIPSSVNYIGNYAFSGCTGLTSLYSLAKTPINISSSKQVFSNVYKECSILYVPYGTRTLYASADQWKDFINIVEMLPSSLPSIDKTSVKVTTYDGKLIIENAESGSSFQIFTASGMKIREQKVESTCTVSLPTGVYIILIGSHSQKVVVK